MTATFLDIDGNVLETPKVRSMAAIRRSHDATTRNCRPMHTGRDGYARRAFQYAMAMHGIETQHSVTLPYSLEQACDWDRAEDGSNRVKAIRTDIGKIEIPHWDFVPSVTEHEAPQRLGAFA